MYRNQITINKFCFIKPLATARGWVAVLLLALWFCPAKVSAQANLVNAEYFYDTDPGFGNGTPISITPGATLNNVSFTSNTVSLSSGIHQLFVRVKDANGNWSISNRTFFYKPVITNAAFKPQLVKAEYFFDNEPGFGNGVNIPVTADTLISNFSFNASIEALSTGIHQMFVRVKDGSGNWSISNRTFFYKPATSSLAAAPNLVKAEYFFDTEPGFGNGTDIPVTAGTTILNQNFTADIDALSTGIHQMFIRVKDANGNWSISNRTFFYKPAATSLGAAPNLVKAEYFFDTEPGFGNGTNIPVTPGTQLLNAGFSSNISALSTGIHQLFVRVKDANGKWSISNRTFFYKAPASSNQSTKIIRAEYFIDADPGFDKAIPYPMSGTKIVTDSVIMVNVSGLNNGTHRLYIRALDNFGKWSVTNTSTFEITNVPAAAFISVTGADKRNLCEGGNLEVGYHATGTYNAGNQFIVELSDPSGSFSSTQTIGSLTATVSGSIICTIPSGLSGSGYKIRVKSSNPVVTSDAFAPAFTATCINTTPPTIVLNNVQNLNCGGVFTGAINITVSGGTAPYTFVWTKTGTPSFTASTEDVTNINVGEYNVTVTDALGNTETLSATVTGPLQLTSSVATSPISCNGASTGGTTVSVSGGTSPYTYLWSNGATTPTVNNLAAGIYSVTVTDASGCTSTSSAEVLQAAILSATPSGTNINCQGIPTGSVTISVTGGNPPYSYLWSNGATTQNISNLLAGTYSVIITDAVGCTATASQTLTNINAAPTATITAGGPITFCLGGSVQLTASAATTYLWNTGATTQSITVSNAGTYTVTVTNSNGCSATSQGINITNTPAPVWFIDADGDGYGTGVNQSQCTRPVNGFLATELTATTGDCDDNNPAVNATRQYFAYSSSAGYTTSVISADTGTSYTQFRFEVDYFDANNQLPLGTYPRVVLDYEGNGVFTDANDRILSMVPVNASDLNTADGKRYFVTFAGLPYGVNYQTRIIANNVNNCSTTFGPFNYPDVIQQPNMTLFANDIKFSKFRTDPGETITITADVNNTSDQPVQNFTVKLISQYNPAEVFDVRTVSYLSPYSKTTVSWSITTPSIPAWVPMQVVIDYGNDIEESNELDNSALRPYVNGNYPVPGNIITTASVSPSPINLCYSSTLTISGNSIYTNTAVPLPDPSVAGATVEFTITETGATYTGYTNSLGQYNIQFPAPPVGTYHITGTVTDFTLTGTIAAQFTTVSQCPVVCTLPDLSVKIYTSASSIVQSNSITSTVVVTNSGQTASPATTLLLSQNGGSSLAQTSFAIPSLAVGASHTISAGTISYSTPGNFALYANVDAAQLITECSETNNYDGVTIEVRPGRPDIIPATGPSGNAYNCPNPATSFTLFNAGGVAAGSFTARVKVLFNNTVVGTYDHAVLGIGFSQYYGFTVPHTYTQFGTYSYEIECDIPVASGGVINELNEFNNTASYQNSFVVLECKPDLYVQNCSTPIVDPVNPLAGGAITLNAQIVNGGNAATAGAFNVRFTYSTGEVFTTTYNSVIAAAGSAVVSVNVTAPAVAGRLLSVDVDQLNVVQELNENNNHFEGLLCHDLQPIASCSGNAFTGTLLLYSNAIPWVPVRTNHLYRSQNVKVKFEVSGPGITGTQNLGIITLGSILNGCNCPTIVSLNNPFAFNELGTYTFTYTVDPDNEFDECNEGNNVMQTQIVVVNQPDMRILSQYINPSKLNPAPGEQVTFTISYENKGRANVADSMKLKILVNGQAHDSVRVSGLVQGDKNSKLMTIPWSSTIYGAHIIRAIIDADNEVVEIDELNNEGTRAIIVGTAANLYFKNFLPSATAPVLGSTITLNALIGNQGDQSCTAKVKFYYVGNNGDSVFIGENNISIAAQGETTVSLPWVVTDVSTNIIAKITDVSELEFNNEDNVATATVGSYSIAFTSVNASCTGAADGTLTATATGGAAPYFYLWSNGFSGQTLTAAGGVYTVTVTDANGEQITGADTILQAPSVASAPITGNTIIPVGGITQLSNTVPGGTWSSSNGLVTVNSTGLVTGVSIGTATISYVVPQTCTPAASIVITIVSGCNPASPITPATPASVTSNYANVCSIVGTITTARITAANVSTAIAYQWTVPAGVTSTATLIAPGVYETNLRYINVLFDGAFVTGSVISVKAKSACNLLSTIARTVTLKATRPAAPVIKSWNGSADVTAVINPCPYYTDVNAAESGFVQYTIRRDSVATGYNWTVSNAATMIIVGNPNDTIVSVKFTSGFTFGVLTITKSSGCGSFSKVLTIKKLSAVKPGALRTLRNGLTPTPYINVCDVVGTTEFVRYQLTFVPLYSTGYNWTLSNLATMQIVGGGTASDNYVDVRFLTGFTFGQVIVQSVNSCSVSAANILTVKATIPVFPPLTTITGATTTGLLCGATNIVLTTTQIATDSITNDYVWTLPAGVTPNANIAATLVGPGIGGTNYSTVSNSIAIDWNSTKSGKIVVAGRSNCGVGKAISLTLVATPSVPAAITVAPVGCPTITAYDLTIASVTGVGGLTPYVWKVPTGVSIVSGQGTTTLRVTIAGTALPTANISVASVNDCGTSLSRTIAVGTVTGTVCGSVSRPGSIITEDGEAASVISAKVIPNPNNGSFLLRIKTGNVKENASIHVMNMLGQSVAEYVGVNNNGIIDVRISNNKLISGVYIVQYILSNKIYSLKMIVEK